MTYPLISFRSARQSDHAALIALCPDDNIGVSRDAMEPDEAYQRAFGAIQADPNHMLAVGEQDGKIVATLLLAFRPGLSRHGARRAQIEAMRVSGALRRQGIGQSLLDWSVAEARKRNCTLVQLTSDCRRIEAHRFNERAGFKPTHFGFKFRLETS